MGDNTVFNQFMGYKFNCKYSEKQNQMLKLK